MKSPEIKKKNNEQCHPEAHIESTGTNSVGAWRPLREPIHYLNTDCIGQSLPWHPKVMVSSSKGEPDQRKVGSRHHSGQVNVWPRWQSSPAEPLLLPCCTTGDFCHNYPVNTGCNIDWNGKHNYGQPLAKMKHLLSRSDHRLTPVIWPHLEKASVKSIDQKRKTDVVTSCILCVHSPGVWMSSDKSRSTLVQFAELKLQDVG